MIAEQIGRLKAVSSRCRQLAATASDGEVAAALRALADDIDLAIPAIEAAVSERRS